MENLQKLAEAVHSDFVAEAIKQFETAARNGHFSHSINGSINQIKALSLSLNEMNIRNTYSEQVGGTGIAFINWGPLK